MSLTTTNITVKLILISLYFLYICESSSIENENQTVSSEWLTNKDSIDIGTFDQSILRSSLFKVSMCCRLNPVARNETNRCKNKRIDQVKIAIPTVWEVPVNLISANDSTHFLLEQRKPFCHKESIQKTLLWNSSVPKVNVFYQNGYLRIGKEFYAQDEYCIDGFTEAGIELNICITDCGNRPCIPKCCPLDKVYNVGVNEKRGCRMPMVSTSSKINGSKFLQQQNFFNPPLYHDFYTQLSKEEISQTLQPHYFLWHPTNFMTNCVLNKTTMFPRSSIIAKNISNHFKEDNIHAIDFRIRKDGAFLYRNVIEKKCKTEKEPKRILCFDGVQDYGSQDGYANSEDEMMVFICNVYDTEHNDGLPDRQPRELVYGVLMLIFSIFPFITSLVYLLLWSRQNVHGWTIATTAGTLFFMYIFQGSALIIGSVYGTEANETLGCTMVAMVSHFFFLATFSWLTVMCCDLWLTFRSLTPTNRRSKGMKRFIKYLIFGWGLPGVFVIVGITLDYVSDDCSSHVLPSYGFKSCSIISSSQGVYVFYPVAILLSLNTFFFVFTCFKLCRYRQNTKFATKKETSHLQCFSRFTKLFLVMGVSWMFDILSWYIDGYLFRWYWVFFDVMNILRAVGVFIVYVCKPDILIALEDEYPSLKRALGPFKRRCSDDLSMQTVSTVSPISLQFPAARASQ